MYFVFFFLYSKCQDAVFKFLKFYLFKFCWFEVYIFHKKPKNEVGILSRKTGTVYSQWQNGDGNLSGINGDSILSCKTEPVFSAAKTETVFYVSGKTEMVFSVANGDGILSGKTETVLSVAKRKLNLGGKLKVIFIKSS